MTECTRAGEFDHPSFRQPLSPLTPLPPLTPLGRRGVVAGFDGGTITSDGGAVLLRELEQRTGILRRFAACFTDYRDADRVEHSVYDLVAQRVYGLALGYEDLNDHDTLRTDPLLAVLVGKDDPAGSGRARERDAGKALAGKSTLNRLELTPAGADESSRYKKVVAHCRDIQGLFVDLFLLAHAKDPAPPERVVLDLDATDDPVHGDQLGRFFHGYYGHYCYLPLYIFCGEHLLCAMLRPSDIDGGAGAVGQLQRVVSAIRKAWPQVKVVVRGDSGFCREHLMGWCEREGVDYVLGLAKNPRLGAMIAGPMGQAERLFAASGRAAGEAKPAARVFVDLEYRTLDSWSRSRRVVAKAEHLSGGPNPRFVVTSLPAEAFPAQTLYEVEYCGRGEMENRIKEQQLYLFADRTSAQTMRANQLRLYFSAVAYTLLAWLRREGLAGTELESARCDTIRLKLLKVGAVVRVTARKVWLSLSGAYPYQELFRRVLDNLRRLPAFPGLSGLGVPGAVAPVPPRC